MITWQERIQSLLETGFSLTALADRLDTPVSTLNDLHKRRSVCPSGDLALKIDALYQERCVPGPGASTRVA